jgi:hypothetical protein
MHLQVPFVYSHQRRGGEPPSLPSSRTSPRRSETSQTLFNADGAEPVIDTTIVCPTFAKRETVSGRFGSYLSLRSGPVTELSSLIVER